MDLPNSLVWIEVDYPDIIAFKEERLQHQSPRRRLSRLKRDLANKTEREQVLADANARAKKILVLTEGVVPYLSEEDVASLAGELKSLDRVAYWVVDYISAIASKYRPRQMKRKMQNAPFKFEPEDWFGFFERHGWRSKEMRYFADEADRLKRPLQFPLWIKLIWVVRAKFLSKQRRKFFRKLAGYALLEPI